MITFFFGDKINNFMVNKKIVSKWYEDCLSRRKRRNFHLFKARIHKISVNSYVRKFINSHTFHPPENRPSYILLILNNF